MEIEKLHFYYVMSYDFFFFKWEIDVLQKILKDIFKSCSGQPSTTDNDSIHDFVNINSQISTEETARN